MLKTPIQIRIGAAYARLFILLASALTLAYSAPFVCTPTAVPALVHAEGLAERLGDILISCAGGTPGGVVGGNLTVFLNVAVTNKLINNFTDVQMTVDNGSGPVAANVGAQPFGAGAVVFNGLSFTLSGSGQANLRISNLRGDANSIIQTSNLPDSITASLAFNQQAPSFTAAQPTVGFPAPGLLTQSSSSQVRCKGSQLPSTITLASLLARGTSFFSTRLTEGFASSFQPKDPLSDTGTGIMVRYSGFPAGARIFVPDYLAGSSAVQQTAGGDLGVAASGGQYAPSAAGSLLLIRVTGADATGAGGAIALPIPGAGTTTFTSASEVTLVGGAGNVVYEVVDANSSIRESAQFPTFVGVLPNSGGGTVVADAKVSFAPLSTVNVASTAPVPRFADVQPQSDCEALGDCNAAYFPKLFVDSPPLDFTSPANAGIQIKYVRVLNNGGGFLNWTSTVAYQSGAGWLTADPASATNNATLFVTVHPDKVGPGTYAASITVDGGPLAGSKVLPVTFTVTSGTGSGAPVIGAVVNAASFQPVPLVAGSLATIMGSNLGGMSVAVSFNAIPAKLLYTGASQINLQVPAELALKTTAQMIVTVDGQSAAQTVALALVSPAIFNGGVLNQDNTLNSASHPADLGSVIQIFATGLLSPGSGTISARIAGRNIPTPSYAGPAPGIPGLQQVNLSVPADLPAGATPLQVCAVAADPNQPVCSPQSTVYLR
jgi:uncharacterized protein (TIGR03437 family)